MPINTQNSDKNSKNQRTSRSTLKRTNPLESYKSELPGMGGIFNSLNLNTYNMAFQNPLKFIDRDGNSSKLLQPLFDWLDDSTTSDWHWGWGWIGLVGAWAAQGVYGSALTIFGLFNKIVNDDWYMTIVDITWGSIGTASGLIAGVINSFTGGNVNIDYKNGGTEHTGGLIGLGHGVSLGPTRVGKTKWSKDQWAHEYGHTVQNREWGIGYLAVMLWSPLRKLWYKKGDYLKHFPETGAESRKKHYKK